MLCHGARMTRQRAIVDEASHHHPSSTQRTMRLPPDPHRIARAPPLRRSDDDNTTIYFPLQKMRKTRVSFSLVGSCAPASVQCGHMCSFHTRSHAAHSHAARVCARAVHTRHIISLPSLSQSRSLLHAMQKHAYVPSLTDRTRSEPCAMNHQSVYDDHNLMNFFS